MSTYGINQSREKPENFQGAFRKIQIDLNRVSQVHLSLLTQGKIPGLLKVNLMIENGLGSLHYQTTSKLSAVEFFSRYTLSPERLKSILNQLLELVEGADRYFLNPACILLGLEAIYIDPHLNKPYFMYDPCEEMVLETDVLDEVWKLIKVIILDKARLENSLGMSEFLELMNQLKGLDGGNHREIMRRWLASESAETNNTERVPKLRLDEMDVMDSVHKVPVDEWPVPIKVTPSQPFELNKEKNKPVQIRKKTAQISFKHKIMAGAMSWMVLLVLISLLRPIGILESLVALVGATLVVMLLFAFEKKPLSEKPEVEVVECPENPLDLVWEKSLEPLTILTDSAGGLNWKDQQIYETPVVDNRTVLLAPSAEWPILKAMNTGVEDIDIKKETLLIGRCASSSDVTLASNTVGRIHAEIICMNGGLQVKDFNTLNGTFVNGNRIGETHVALHNMDLLKFSCFEFRVVLP